MKATALVFLLLGCASTKPGPTQTTRHWTPKIRASVLLQCQAQMGEGKFCECLTDKLETISPDPDAEFTPEDIRRGVSACRQSESASASSSAEAPI